MNKEQPLITYACRAIDEPLRMNSSSGGIFSLLATQVISSGGVVYGTALSDDCREARIIKVSDTNDLSKLRGSKYLQSKNIGIYRDISRELADGKIVLFSGTPCQVAGLKLFLGKEYANLLCVDIICHGTPSPKLWNEYVDYIESKYGGVLSAVNFRCKDQSWKKFGMKESIAAREVFVDKDFDPYMQLFLKNYSLRPSCYNCRSKEMSFSDITIGDFWGVDLFAPEMDDGKGTSIVFIRSKKGIESFEGIKSLIERKEVSYEDAISDNPAEYKSVGRPLERDTLFDDMSKMSFKKLYCKYLYPKPKHKIKLVLIKLGIWTYIKKSSMGGGYRKQAEIR